MSSKRGTKERHRAQEASQQAYQGLGNMQNVLQSMFPSAFQPGAGGAEGTMQAGQGALQSLFGQIPQLANFQGGALPVGLNAPGILDSLIARGRESTSSASRQAAQEMSNLLPTGGGSALRGITDIYRSGAGQAAQLETGLRAEAAQRALTDRLAALAGVSGSIGSVGGGLSSGTGSLMDIFNSMAGLEQGQAGVLGQFSNQMNQQYLQKQQQYSNMMGSLGQAIGSVGLNALMSLLGGLGGAGGGVGTGSYGGMGSGIFGGSGLGGMGGPLSGINLGGIW